MTDFKNKVTMRVTREQYEKDLEKPLEKLGYTWDSNDAEDFEGWNILSINIDNNTGMVCIDAVQFKEEVDESIFIENYNPQLFLALATMREGDELHVGEYMYCIEGYDKNLHEYITGNIYEVVNSNFSNAYCKKTWRKATVEELIEHFSEGYVDGRENKELNNFITKLNNTPNNLYNGDGENLNTKRDCKELPTVKEVLDYFETIPNEGYKESSGKLNYELDWDFIKALAERMESGSKKYDPYNWKKPIDPEQLKQAMFRHVIEVMKGNYEDDGRPLAHIESIAANAMMLFYQINHK